MMNPARSSAPRRRTVVWILLATICAAGCGGGAQEATLDQSRVSETPGRALPEVQDEVGTTTAVPSASARRASVLGPASPRAGASSVPSRGDSSSAATTRPVDVEGALLVRQDLGEEWDDLDGRSAEDTHAAYEYCLGPFQSQRLVTGRAATELIRRTDGLRVQQDSLAYRGDGAASALDEFRRALRECRSYTSASDPSLVIDMRHDEWASTTAAVSGSVRFRRGELDVHSLLAVLEGPGHLVVLSVVDTDLPRLRREAPRVLRAAVARFATARTP